MCSLKWVASSSPQILWIPQRWKSPENHLKAHRVQLFKSSKFLVDIWNFATFLNINIQQKHRFEHTGVTEYYQPKQCTIFFGEILQICRNTFCCLFSFPGIPAGCQSFCWSRTDITLAAKVPITSACFLSQLFRRFFLDSTTRFAHTSDGSTFGRHTNLVPFQCRACRIQNLNSNTSELLFLGEVLCFEFLDLK